MDRSHRGVDAAHLTRACRTAAALAALAVPAAASAQTPPAASIAAGRPVHVVLVGDSTVTEGAGWGLGFRHVVGPGVRVTNTAQNGRSSKSFRDEGHWAAALAAKGDYYLIQFGHNDQPGKGSERETDPATTFPANMARYVDDVRAIGATPILVTSLVRRTFKEVRNLDDQPATLVSTLGPWVEAVRRVSIEKRVPLIDLDASSRALCERLGPVQTAGFNPSTNAGTWDTTHLDAAGSAAFAQLVVDDLRAAVPALAPFLVPPATQADAGDPPDMPAPHPLLSPPNPNGLRVPFGRVYTRAIRLARVQRRDAFHGRESGPAALPPLVTSPAIVVAWEFVPDVPPVGRVDCGFGPVAPREVFIRPMRQEPRADLQPLAIYAEPRRIRELLEPFESDLRRVRWVTVLDPSRLRPDTLLAWRAPRPCGPSADRVGEEHSQMAALITQADIDRWSERRPPAQP